jgi:membrane protease YdiL (CAAX protease family)
MYKLTAGSGPRSKEVPMQGTPKKESDSGWGLRETSFTVWVGLALASLLPVAAYLDATLPVFTVIWLIVPLVSVLRARNAERVGFGAVALRELAIMAGLNVALLLLVMAIFEPWSDAYGTLVREAIAGDPTFAWLHRYQSPSGWLLMFIYSATVTIFAEELFFRGWLLQWLLQRMGQWRAILLQAALFAVPQALPALFLTP